MGDTALALLYEQRIMDYYRNPRCYGTLEVADFSTQLVSPSCGDSIQFQGKIQAGTLHELAFQGKGSVLTLASASLLAEQALGQHLKIVLLWDEAFMKALVKLELGPARMKHLMLPLQVLQQGLNDYARSHKIS